MTENIDIANIDEIPADADMTTWFVVHEAPEEDGTNEDSTPLALPAHQEDEIRKTFKEDIDSGFVSKNRGLLITKLTGVTEDQQENLFDLDKLSQLVATHFKGYKTEVVETWGTSGADWSDASLEDNDDDIEVDENGIPVGAVVNEDGSWTYEQVTTFDEPYAEDSKEA